MPARHLPVRPDLEQLKHQAKDLLRAIRRGEAEALADLAQFHPRTIEPHDAKLADAQLVLARSYHAPSWPRLVTACRLVDAIWKGDLEAVRALVERDPRLLQESALIRESNWGPPLSYAANLGRDRIIELLQGLGATDLEHAFDRAVLQSQVATARMLHAKLGRPRPPLEVFGSAAYTMSVSGTALLFELSGEMKDAAGNLSAAAGVVLQSDSRAPDAKHAILEMYAAHGLPLPDTPTMALHRGRLDLLEAHLARDPALLKRTFAYEETFPLELDCHEERLPRTTLHGATLLHVAVEFDELEIARWLLDRGADPDARAAVDAAGFGGHTALFGAVVCYANFWRNFVGGRSNRGIKDGAAFARLLLDRGADPNARASLREPLWVHGESEVQGWREHRDVTPLAWGEAFGYRLVVSEAALALVAERGGRR